MYFASPLPWWLAVLVAAGIGAVAFLSYRRPLAPLTRVQQVGLMALRALALSAVGILLWRPVVLLPPAATGEVVIPVLVDVSRSMRVADADGISRIARAAALLRTTLVPALSSQARVELMGVGDGVSPVAADALSAEAGKTDLVGAVATIRDRFRGRRVPGIVLISDGGDTGTAAPAPPTAGGPPVFAIGVGSPQGLPDREVTGMAAGDPRLDQASVDLHVSVAARGLGRDPFQLRVLANGQLVDSRRIAPPADGSPIDATFTVLPDPQRAVVYTAEIAADPGESIAENNSRSMVVNPAGRRRRVLTLTGAPGYEHAFLVRALMQDPALDVDSVVRKGKNDQNQDTFLVQAGGGRGAALTTGFPATRDALFGYDALVIANVEGDFFTRAQLAMAAEFVGERGGGLLVLGGRSFEQRGLMGTALEPVLPIELNDRRGTAVRPAEGEDAPGLHDTVVLTEQGRSHPVMRIGATPEESARLWATLPALASNAPLGGPRPGASVLAVTASSSGMARPVVAVQRYGRGRSMVFAGEASWRWRMMEPATDRRYEFFWRQALRWLSADAPDPVTVTVPSEPEPGDTVAVEVGVRDAAFAPVQDATVDATLTLPGGQTMPLAMRRVEAGRFTAAALPAVAGAYRIQVDARRGSLPLGSADRWVYVGGQQREFADPRMNEGFLRRLARESGGKYERASDASRLVADLQAAVPQSGEPERRDLWDAPWIFAMIVAIVSAEWLLRRAWGLR